MNAARRKPRRQLLYDDPVDCGVFTTSSNRKVRDDTRTITQVNHNTTPSLGMYALFVGHGGHTASELCARNFIPTLLEDVNILKRKPEQTIQRTCDTLEAFVIAKSTVDKIYYGTTLLFAFVFNNKLFITNIGNSRAILSTLDGNIYSLSNEHDINSLNEVSRILESGGYFNNDKVMNLIRVTRSIGDLELKGRKHITFPNIQFKNDVIISSPDIISRHLTRNDHFIIMATPEIWETLSNKTVVQLVNISLRKKESTRTAAKRVANAAIAQGAIGPLTVMVLLLTGKLFEQQLDHNNNNTIDNTIIERRHTHFGAKSSPGKRLAAVRAKSKWGSSNHPVSSAPVSPATSTTRRQKKKTVAERTANYSGNGHGQVKVEIPQLLTSGHSDRVCSGKILERRSPPSVKYQPMGHDEYDDDDDDDLNMLNVGIGKEEGCNNDVIESKPLANARFMLSKLSSDVMMTESARVSGRITHSRSAVETAGTAAITKLPSKKQHHHKLKLKQNHHNQRIQSALDCLVANDDEEEEEENNSKYERRGVGKGIRVSGGGRRYTAQSVQSTDIDRRGSGKWPMSDLTSSGVTTSNRPSSSHVSHVSQVSQVSNVASTDDRRHVDMNGLDYGASGPSKVRYREDGTTIHGGGGAGAGAGAGGGGGGGRRAFFGWNLGRRR